MRTWTRQPAPMLDMLDPATPIPVKSKILGWFADGLRPDKEDHPALTAIHQDRASIMVLGGQQPDPWQATLLRSQSSRIILCCSRQVGKTEFAACLALIEAMLLPRSTILLLSPSERQSGELMARVFTYYDVLDQPIKTRKRTELQLHLTNGSRIIALPDNEKTIRCYSGVRLLVVDEASQVPDSLYRTVRPMLAVSRGRLLVLSTPFGQRGWFYEAWTKDTEWERVQINADQCSRITPEFLEEERQKLGERWFRQEYFCHRFSTEVLVASGGSKHVSELVVGDKLLCYSRDGCLAQCGVVAKRLTGEQETVIVKTETGRTFTATANHPVCTRIGKQPLGVAAELQYIFARNYSDSQLEAKARLVGHNFGDGTITKRISKSGKVFYNCSWYGKEREDMLFLCKDTVRSCLQFRQPKLGFKRGAESKFDSWQVQIGGMAACSMVKAGCPVGKKVSLDFDVPMWVMNGCDNVKTEFLAALFGAEGSTPSKNFSGKKCVEPQLTMFKDPVFPGDRFFSSLVSMLKSLGIESVYRTRNDCRGHVAYTLRIVPDIENVIRFFENVGYRYAVRKELLAFQWAAYLSAYSCSVALELEKIAALRCSGLSWKRVSAELGYSGTGAHARFNSCAKRESRPGVNRFQYFDDWISERQVPNGLFVNIVGLDENCSEPTVNIEVDSCDHSYLLKDGLNNYNCSFADAVGAVFSQVDIDAALVSGVPPLILDGSFVSDEPLFVR